MTRQDVAALRRVLKIPGRPVDRTRGSPGALSGQPWRWRPGGRWRRAGAALPAPAQRRSLRALFFKLRLFPFSFDFVDDGNRIRGEIHHAIDVVIRDGPMASLPFSVQVRKEGIPTGHFIADLADIRPPAFAPPGLKLTPKPVLQFFTSLLVHGGHAARTERMQHAPPPAVRSRPHRLQDTPVHPSSGGCPLAFLSHGGHHTAYSQRKLTIFFRRHTGILRGGPQRYRVAPAPFGGLPRAGAPETLRTPSVLSSGQTSLTA